MGLIIRSTKILRFAQDDRPGITAAQAVTQ
jgi:hypothetical protein